MLDENVKLLDDYFSLRSVSKNTVKIYTQALESYESKTEEPLSRINKDSLTQWFKKVSDTLSSASIEKYGQQLRTLYAFTLEGTGLSKRKAKAEAEELFELIPFSDLRKRTKKNNKLKDKVVTQQEFQALMNSTMNPRLKALISVTYESGCRKGEILSLKLKDVSANGDHWTLTVEGKTGTRTVPIIKSIPYLRAWIQLHPDRENENQFLFVGVKQGRIQRLTPMGFNNSLRYLCNKAKIRNIYPHQLRHTRLTRLAEDGLGEFQMKSFAGWTADSKMAAEYVHLSGRGHVNAVLEVEGVSVEHNGHHSTPLIELSRCPNCDEPIDPKWVQCPACQFILDDKLGMQKQDKIRDLETQLEALKRLVEEKLSKE